MAVPVTTTMQNQIANLYIAILGRNPEPAGFSYWVDAYANANATPSALQTITLAFGKSPEFIATYGGKPTQDAVAIMYQNVLNRAPDAGGLAYWTAQTNALITGGRTVGEALALTANNIITAAAANTGTADATLIATKQAVAVAAGTTAPATTYTLTTSIDTATANFFDGSFSAEGRQTLNSGDQLTGKGATGNVLDASIGSSVTPALLSNIQTVEISSFTQANTVGLANATGVTSIVNDSSLQGLTFANVGASATNVGIKNTSAGTAVLYTTTTGTQSINLNLQGVGANAPAEVIIAGVENVAINSSQSANSVDLELSAATTLTASGSANLTIAPLSTGGNTINVSSVNASAMTGNLTIDMGNQSGVAAATVITVTGGAGNDGITLSSLTQRYIATGGAGNDTFTDTGITDRDSIEGGDGTDTLSTTFAAASGLTTVNGVNGIDTLSFSDALNGALTLATVDSTINAITVTAAGALTAQASNITGPAGTLTANLGRSAAGYAGQLAHTVTFTDTGTATTDSLTINNSAVDSTTNTSSNVFNGQNITSAGYENVSVNTGSAGNLTPQTIGTLTINADAASAPVSLTLTGNNSATIASLASNSTGLTTLNASGLTAQVAGTNSFTLTTTALATAASTLSVTGTAGDDVISSGAANAYSATIEGGAGNDTITGGTGADNLHGDRGNDSITGSGGNDTLRGGEGNDTIDATVAGVVSIDGGAGNDTVSIGATLGATDVINGGDNIDTLAVTAAIAANAGVGITNFEILSTTADQVLTNAINNSWTTVLANAQGVDITNALSTTNTFQVNTLASGGAASFDRLTDTGTDSLTLATAGTVAGNITLTQFTADDEESITLDVSNGASSVAGSLTIDTLTAADLTSLTLTGDHSVTITNAVGSTTLATVNASGITASAAPLGANTVNVSAANSTVAVTMTGSTTVANTFVGGLNADSITGGNLADNLTGGNGADTLIGGGGADVLLGGAGADSINAGTGTDAITAGTQADTVTLTVDAQTDTITQAASDSVAATATAFQGANFAAGDTMTFGNGVDLVQNFLAGAAASGGDTLVIGTAVSQSLLGTATNGAAIGWLSGTYSGGVFTVAANGIGPDTMVLIGGTLGAATSRTVILQGVDSDNLLNSNFGGFNNTNLTATYAGTTWTVNGQAIQAITVDATSVTPNITAEAGATFSFVGTYVPAQVTTIDFSNVTGGFGSNVTLNGVINAVLATITGTSGNDTYTFATEDLGAAGGTTFAASTGTDTLVLTNVDNSVTRGGGGANSTLTSISNISLTNGTRNAADTTTQTLTIGGAVAHAVTNASATAAATVNLGTTAGNSYTSSSSGVDTVTLNAAAQSVSTGTGSDQVNLAVAVSQTGAINMGTGAADVLSLTAAGGTYNLTGSVLTGIDTLNTGNINAAFVLEINTANDAAIGAYNFNGGTADTLRLADGTYNFSAKTITFATAASTLDLDSLGTGAKTLTLDAADINNVTTITGDAVGLTSLNFNDTTSLAGRTVTNIGAIQIAGANQTLTIDGDEAGVAGGQYLVTTGSGTSNLIYAVGVGAAAIDLTTTTVSGFDNINFAAALGAADNDLTIDALSIVTGGATTITADALNNLAVTETYNASNWSVTGFDLVTVTAAQTLTVADTFFNATNATYNGNATGQLIINMAGATLNLGGDSFGAGSNIQTTINGTAGNDTITLADAKAAGSGMEVNGNGGLNSFRLEIGSGNAADAIVLADAVSVNDFISANDTVAVASADLAGVSVAVGAVAAGTLNYNTGSAGFALITGATVADFSNFAAVTGAIGNLTATGTDSVFIAVTNADESQVAVYNVVFAANRAATTIQAGDTLTLVGILDNTGDFAATNLGLF